MGGIKLYLGESFFYSLICVRRLQVEINDAVEAKVDEITDSAVEIKVAIEAKVDEAKENIEDVVEEMAKADNATDTPLVDVVEKESRM